MKLIIPLLDINESGGVKVLFKLSDFLIEEGHEVIFITFVPDPKKKINFGTKAKIQYINSSKVWMGIKWRLEKVCSFSIFKCMSCLPGIFDDIVRCFIILANIPTCDVLMANYYLTAYPVWLSKKARHKLYYCQAFEPRFFLKYGQKIKPNHVRVSLSIKNAIYRYLALISYKLPLHIIANNEGAAAEIKKYLRKPELDIPIVYPGIERVCIADASSKINIIPKVGLIATPVYWKGSAYFMEAVKILRSDDPTLAFDVVCAFGPPPAGSPDVDATWVNPRSPAELTRFYGSLDILVSPMLICGEFPLPPLEAMAAGTAVISTKLCYGIDGEHYLEIPPKDPQAIAGAVYKLIKSRSLREKIAGNGHSLSKNYNWDNTKMQFLPLVRDIGSGKWN